MSKRCQESVLAAIGLLERQLRSLDGIDFLKDADCSCNFAGSVAQRLGRDTSPDLLAVVGCIKHFGRTAFCLTAQRLGCWPVVRVEHSSVGMKCSPATDTL